MSSLNQILDDLISQAQEMPGWQQTASLARGLQVTVKFYEDDLWLGLARFDVEPSQQEIKTVLKCWPGDNARLAGEAHSKVNNRYWVYGIVKTDP